MGTNYYWQYNECLSCKRFDRLHIGKSSGGWQFNFRGYRDYNIEFHGVAVNINIRSWKDWQDLIRKGNGKIVNEYGEEVTLQYLMENVETPERKKMLNFYDYCTKNHPEMKDDIWKDEEGYSFHDREFS